MRASVRWIAVASVLALAACSSVPGPTGVTAATTSAEARVPPAGPSDSGARVPQAAPAVAPSCDPDFRPTSTTLFNDPAGSRSAQFRLQTDLVRMIDCTPPTNPDGTQASIKLTFYSLTLGPVRRALVAAARRGVSVQVLTNSHADRFRAWTELVDELGSDSRNNTFAVACWQGCLRPRQPPAPGGPTAWFAVRTTSADSRTAVFTDLSKAGSAPIASWFWDFGDGTSAQGRGPHRHDYRSDGIYSTSLTVRDSLGVTHRMSGDVTIPDKLEPMYPALHVKMFLSSTVGTGRGVTRWVTAYGSGNPTYAQARRGFNNVNISVGDREMYQAFEQYFEDLRAASQGRLLTHDYNRTTSTPGHAQTGSPPTIIHFMPRDSGDLQLEVLRSIECQYMRDGRMRRTRIRITMFAISRLEIGAELWRLAYERGCAVDILYATMTQRLRADDGTWVRDEAGALMGWGPADCLATAPTRRVRIPGGPGSKSQRTETPNTIDSAGGLCAGGTLDGRVAGTTPGTWIDRVSPISGGRLTVTAGCPVETHFDSMLRTWVFACRESRLFTHEKVLLVDGLVHGRVQKYVMTGSANWTDTGLHHNDDVVTELLDAPTIHDAYLRAHRHQKEELARANATAPDALADPAHRRRPRSAE